LKDYDKLPYYLGPEHELEHEFYVLLKDRRLTLKQWKHSNTPARLAIMQTVKKIEKRIIMIFEEFIELGYNLSKDMQSFNKCRFPKNLKRDIVRCNDETSLNANQNKSINPPIVRNLFKSETLLNDITISFEDEYIIKIKGPRFSERFVYTQLGFASKYKPSTLNRLGLLLQYFSQNNGSISLNYLKNKLHGVKDNSIHQSIARLRKIIQQVLGTNSNPIKVIRHLYELQFNAVDNATPYRETQKYQKIRKSTGTPSKDLSKHLHHYDIIEPDVIEDDETVDLGKEYFDSTEPDPQ